MNLNNMEIPGSGSGDGDVNEWITDFDEFESPKEEEEDREEMREGRSYRQAMEFETRCHGAVHRE